MLTQKEIQTWLKYWDNAKTVAFDEIRLYAHVAQARKYCRVMNAGVFSDVTDGQIWEALRQMRGVK